MYRDYGVLWGTGGPLLEHMDRIYSLSIILPFDICGSRGFPDFIL